MHKALYRKWRPLVFDDVIGQDYIVTVLKNQVATGKIGHAYLFTGTRGTGKTTCAKIFSKAVNCTSHINGDPCLECDICSSIQNGSAIDVVEIDAASHTGVDNIRDIIEESVYLPAVCKYRVYIIDEVHMLSTSAFNALLKIMEEPPAHIIFILATTEVHQVPVTIISRCQRFDFSRISDSLIIEQLLKVADGEGIQLDMDAACVIARLADGGMRDALSLFDQCAGFDNHVTYEVVSKVSGQADKGFIKEMADAVCNEDTATALSLSMKAHSSSYSFSFIISELVTFFRDIMVAKSVGVKNGELFKSGTDIALISEYTNKLTMGKIMYCLDTLSDTLNSIGKSSYPNISFEECLIRLCTPSLSGDSDALISRIEKLEQRLISVPTDFSPFSQQIKKEEPTPAPAPKATSKAKEKPSDIDISVNQERNVIQFSEPYKEHGNKQPFTLWNKVIEELSKINRPLAAPLKRSNAYIEGDIIYIDADEFTEGLLDKSREDNRQSLKSAVIAVSGKDYKICPKINTNKTASSKSPALNELLENARRNGVEFEKH